MGPLARTGIGIALACGVLVTAVGVGRNSDSDHEKEPPKGPYVALGDSYTSGPKIPPQTGDPAGCDRSGRNYPALVARELGIEPADFRDVSCSGATIAHLTAPQSTDHGTNPAQLSALSAGTMLVTLGIGGNDVGFSSLITNCVTTGALYELADHFTDVSGKAPCERRYTSGDTDTIAQQIHTTGDQLARALHQIKRRAPGARVYVVGYPAILPAKGTDCDDAMPLAPDDVVFLRDKEQQLNTMLRYRARAAGATYVDTFTPSSEHNACSPESTRWIEPLRPSSPAASVHPNERGERGMATAVLHAVKD
ncbi:SGNH/GDSL hydrolase family protein [Streptomyces sp. NPDC046862]|uniref:SGNH/GDSL hydrolase family protein n=1 Tax=Streptomyces sp. NPDC046862 TaxID=3154603 RepID=UPI00345245B8